jgi:hypothetical protein
VALAEEGMMIRENEQTPFRKIVNVAGSTLTLDIPEYLRRRKLEVLLLPLETAVAIGDGDKGDSESVAELFGRFHGALPDFPEVDSEGNFEDRRIFE